jgi:hypothetical protein
VLLAGCAPAPFVPPPDVVGPYSGPVARFTVDKIVLPLDHTFFAVPFAPDGPPRNHLGDVDNALDASSDSVLPRAIVDQIAAGTIDLSVEVQSDDPTLTDDPQVGVTLVDGPLRSQPLGATLVRGVLQSNPIQYTTHPVDSELTLPVMVDADPFTVELQATELVLFPDGAGGFQGELHGALRDSLTVLSPQVARAMMQELALHPDQHPLYLPEFDYDHDGTISPDEVEQDTLTHNLLQPDVQLFDGDQWAPRATSEARDSFTLGLQLHLTPCASGRCVGAIVDHCDDRQRDGDESDVDCGGSCSPCPGGASCALPADCQSQSCIAGRCAAPSCTDGVKDNLETDVDCGGPLLPGRCRGCATGQACQNSGDCAARYSTCIAGRCS